MSRIVPLLAAVLLTTAARAETPPEAEAPLPHPDPCALLTEALVRSELGLKKDQVFEARVKTKYSPKNLCNYRWPKKDLEAINARNKKKAADSVMARVEAMKKGEKFELELERTHEEVSLSVPGNHLADEAQATRTFDAAVKLLREGMTRTVRGKTVTMHGKPQLPVKGLGDDAVWGKENHRLGVRAGRLILWITVDAGKKGQEKQHAVALVRAILKSDAGQAAQAPEAAE